MRFVVGSLRRIWLACCILIWIGTNAFASGPAGGLSLSLRDGSGKIYSSIFANGSEQIGSTGPTPYYKTGLQLHNQCKLYCFAEISDVIFRAADNTLLPATASIKIHQWADRLYFEITFKATGTITLSLAEIIASFEETVFDRFRTQGGADSVIPGSGVFVSDVGGTGVVLASSSPTGVGSLGWILGDTAGSLYFQVSHGVYGYQATPAIVVRQALVDGTFSGGNTTLNAGQTRTAYFQIYSSGANNTTDAHNNLIAERNPQTLQILGSSSGVATLGTYDPRIGYYNVNIPSEPGVNTSGYRFSNLNQNQYNTVTLRIPADTIPRNNRVCVNQPTGLWGSGVTADEFGLPMGGPVAVTRGLRSFHEVRSVAGQPTTFMHKGAFARWGESPAYLISSEDLGSGYDNLGQMWQNSVNGINAGYSYNLVHRVYASICDVSAFDGNPKFGNTAEQFSENTGGHEFLKYRSGNEGANLLSNAGFENGSGVNATAWTNIGSERSSDKARTGSFSMKTTELAGSADWTQAYQTIAVQRNTLYRARVWCAAGTMPVFTKQNLLIYGENTANFRAEYGWTTFAPNFDWTLMEVTFDSGENDTVRLMAVNGAIEGATGASVYWDDAELTKITTSNTWKEIEFRGLDYERLYPSLVDLDWHGFSADKKITTKVELHNLPFSDTARMFVRMRYDVNDTVLIGPAGSMKSNFRLFTMGDEDYGQPDFPSFAWTDASGTVQTMPWTDNTIGLPLGGPQPFCTVYPNFVGNRGIVVRSYQARINGVQNNSPAVTLQRSNGKASGFRLVPDSNESQLIPGDYFDIEMELVFYGTENSDITTMLEEAAAFGGTALQYSASRGTLLETLPMRTAADAGGRAQFTMQGGRNYIPVEISGLDDYTDATRKPPLLERLTNGVWVPYDATVKGNDGWSVHRDETTGKYAFLYNVWTDGAARELRFSLSRGRIIWRSATQPAATREDSIAATALIFTPARWGVTTSAQRLRESGWSGRLTMRRRGRGCSRRSCCGATAARLRCG